MGAIQRKWLALVASWFGYATSYGLLNTIPILYREWLHTFEKSRAETAVVQSVCAGINNVIGVLVGILVTKYGPRPIGIIAGILLGLGFSLSFFATSITYLTLVFSILAGLGFGGILICSTVVVGRFFEGKQKYIALSSMSVAGSAGSTGFTYVIDKMSRVYGWRGCMLIIGAIVLHNIPFFGICNQHTRQNSSSSKNEEKSGKTVFTLMKDISGNINFLVYIVALSSVGAAMLSNIVIIVDFFHFSGFSRDDSVLLFLVMSIVGMGTRIIPGLLKQLKHVSIFAINVFHAAVGTIALLLFPSMTSFVANAVLMGCVGFSTAGSMGSVMYMTVLRIVGVEHYPIAVGIALSSMGICRVIGGPIGGYLRDVTGLYDATFYLNGGICCLGVFLYVVLFYVYTSKTRRTVKISERHVGSITGQVYSGDNTINRHITTADREKDNPIFIL